MKIIRTIFFSLLVFISITCIGIFIFFQTFDFDQYLPPITNKASLALGRSVSIKHAALNLSSKGITLDAGPVIIADDLNFTTQPFIKIDRVRIFLDLKSLILQRKINITEILLQSPQIHFIRSEEGKINARSFVQASRSTVIPVSHNVIPAKAGIQNQEQPKQQVSINGSNSNPIGIKNFSIKIQDASISYIDQSQTFPLDIWLNGINGKLDAYPSGLSKRSIQISDLGLDIDFSQLDIKEFKGIAPKITGIVQLNLADLEFGNSGALTVKGDINITDGVIKNFNIIKSVLSHTLGLLGGIDGAINNIFSGPLRGTLTKNDTIIQKAKVQFSFHDKTFFIDDSLIQTDIFEFTAQGSFDQGLNMDMETMLHLNEDVSSALVNGLGGLKLFYDDSNRIAIGANLKGAFPHLKYKPNKDFRKKSRRFLMQEGGNILGILFGGGKI